jgi:hypothetical protein
MPAQKPGSSTQEVQTPPEFLTALQARLGHIVIDVAATNENRVSAIHYGPGSGLGEDGLTQPWARVGFLAGLRWCNPPFSDIAKWAAKCAVESIHVPVALLVPASVGSTWFNKYVRPYAYVFELNPRLTFVGHRHPYPKDLLLAYYSPARLVGRDSWCWRPPAAKAPANDNAVDPRQMPLPLVAVG